METVQRHSWFRRQSPQRLRVVLLSLVIVIVGFQTTDRIFSIILVNILLCLAHIAVLWIPDRLVGTDRRRIVIVFVLWIAMAVPWGVFHNVSISISLLFYLIAYIALRLPSSKSSLLAAGVIAGDAAIMLWTGEPYDFIWMYSIFHAAIYIFVWGDRVRREAEDVSKRHFRELGETHAKLERTHLELRKAHGELEQAHTQLEEAAGRSLRYAVLEERSRIARDIHDSIGHGLTSVIVQLQAMPYVLRTNPAEADQMVATVLDVARRCLTE
ncbi:histidine kinase dimerization/phosphoacceptor domain-containing protein, partial [Paenibacillus sepulcri]|nr:histidine kinase dimerization/phosphoacceptor domain-containing protein [Paenibacillus sepulcri]